MARIDQIAAHPLEGRPYDKLIFVELNHHYVPIYRVVGCDLPAAGAFEALGRAFEKYGGECFYCRIKFKAQPLSLLEAHRDHVIATSLGGSALLHNLVIACKKCGRDKSNDPVHDFRPKAAKAYLSALERHIADCVKASSADN